MSNKIKTILSIVIFIALITGAVSVYNHLSERYAPENPALDNKGNVHEDQNTDGNTGTAEPENNSDAGTGMNEGKADDENEERFKALDFTAYDYDGNKVALYDYIGTPIVLNFWASWCGPCRNEMPHFNKVSEEYSDDEVIFLMVDLVDGQRETVEKGKQFVEENGFTFTVLFDSDQDAAYTYMIRSIPTTLFINSEGYIEAGVEGMIDETTLRRGISLILDK